eukprot:TRINITY_DN47695_c0_g1_i1.p1 TRINITY_DN47695_c0_g1~~TRINITY_DN47695_c0_g1_i1.p1  ORF type:complete len:1037 (+),score=216.87 TRINITY_DN47695_c0_g1_i1:119-3229(+)
MSFRVERRFNLLILEEGEEYISDVSSTMTIERRGKAAECKGRLRIASKSLVFQPDEVSANIVKFPYRYVKSISDALRPEESFTVQCDQFVQVATKTGTETRIVTPFSTSKAKISVKFSVHYASTEDYLRIVRPLHEASSKSVTEAEQVVKKLLEQEMASVQFDMSRLGHRERALLPKHVWVRRVKPLLEVRGMLQISDEAIYFQPHPNFQSKPVKRLPHGDVLHVFQRIYGVQANALEIITISGSCVYLVFEARSECDHVASIIQERRREHSSQDRNGPQIIGLPTVGSAGEAEDVLHDVHRMTALWQSGLLSNFHYLDFLNCAAGRSQNDFSQYPVFPWVLREYAKSALDLSDPEVYRDLAKPIGALNPKRLDYFKERQEGMLPEERFLYGTHYSTPAYVIYWLLRAMPERMLRLHGGHFDAMPRLFKSVPDTWETVNESTASLMELIPEFFALPCNWLENSLGITTAEAALGNVVLPPWATSVQDFICKMRAALESDLVSRTLPAWIDLIFGYKQTGTEAAKADNLFHPVCYMGHGGGRDGRGVVNSTLPRHVLETQLQEFGRMPRQLFVEAHPPRLRIPRWEPERLLEEPMMSEPWYKAVRHISTSASVLAGDLPAVGTSTSTSIGVGVSPASSSGSKAERPAAAQGGGGGYASAGAPSGAAGCNGQTSGAQSSGSVGDLTTSILQSLVPQAASPLSASGSITGVACCSSNMYAIGEDGCLRVSPLTGNSASAASTAGRTRPGGGSEVDGTSTPPLGAPSLRRNFRISPMPLSALAVLKTDLLVIGGHDNAVTLYSSSCGSALAKCQVHADTVTCLGVSSCGGVIVSGSRDQSVRTWSPMSSGLKSELTFDDLQQPLTCCAASRNLIVAGATDGQLIAWDRRSGQPVMDRDLGVEGVEMCAVNDEGTVAAALDGAGELRLWDLRHRCESVRLSVLARGANLCKARCFLTDFTGWALIGGSGASGVPAVSLWGLPEQRELRAWPLAQSQDRRGSEVQFLVRPPVPTASPEGCAGSAVPVLCADAAGAVHVFARA